MTDNSRVSVNLLRFLDRLEVNVLRSSLRNRDFAIACTLFAGFTFTDLIYPKGLNSTVIAFNSEGRLRREREKVIAFSAWCSFQSILIQLIHANNLNFKKLPAI